MTISQETSDASHSPGNLSGGTGAHDSAQLLEAARADTDTVLKGLASQLSGPNSAD